MHTPVLTLQFKRTPSQGLFYGCEKIFVSLFRIENGVFLALSRLIQNNLDRSAIRLCHGMGGT